MNSLLLITTLVWCLSTVWSSNILGIFPMPARSHYSMGQVLLEELARKGHNVTMIAPFKENRQIKNYNEIHLEGLYDSITGAGAVYFDMATMPPMSQAIIIYNLGYVFSSFTLKCQSVLDLINSNQKFDVVILDQFMSEALLAIPYKLNAPVIYISSLISSIWCNHLVANPAPLSHVPNLFLNYKGALNFFERIDNVIQYILEELYRQLIAFPKHEQIAREAFPDIPDLNTLMYSRSPFLLINSHISISDPIPHVPNMVEVGGYHPRKQALPSDLKEYLDNSKDGVVFLGMGSNLPVMSFPIDKRESILKALGKLKQNILLKWEDDFLPNKPPNVITRKWLPQQAILAHPNTKAFISHGGLLSCIEAVYYGVPIIGIPILADQKLNINLAVNRGYGLAIPYFELTEETLTNAMQEILNNSTYHENAKTRSALMHERPVPPLQEAVFWVEHVIKHNGSEHFRNSGMDLKWYQYSILDVVAFMILVCVTILIGVYLVIKRIFCSRYQHFIDKNKKVK